MQRWNLLALGSAVAIALRVGAANVATHLGRSVGTTPNDEFWLGGIVFVAVAGPVVALLVRFTRRRAG